MRILKLLPVALAATMPVSTRAQSVQALPHSIVYKTATDHSKHVQVELAADGSLLAYPAPTDVQTAPGPVKLKKGYYLSRSGVSANTRYLDMTVEEYAALKTAPTPEELQKHIKDTSPMTELWDCGTRDEVSVKQLNKMIAKGKLATKCKRIK